MTDLLPPASAAGPGHPLNGTSVTDAPQQDLTELLYGLERRLASQPLIEQAKGILMGRFGISSENAFVLLRRWSSHTNLKVRDMCQMLVDAATQQTDSRRPDQHLAELVECLNQGRRPPAEL